MLLDRVTITGADDSVRPEDLQALTREFPYVEWGILASQSQTGNYRYPSNQWIGELTALTKHTKLPLSLHLCGRWVRDLLVGEMSFPLDLIQPFKRIQLNFHAESAICDKECFQKILESLLPYKKQFIFQIDGASGNRYFEALYNENTLLDIVTLYDTSGGVGVLPDSWPKPLYLRDRTKPPSHYAQASQYAYHGYAGGLGPDTLPDQLPRIAEAAGDIRCWIDMETRVRSNDELFDLVKVRQALEICQPWVNQISSVA